MARNKHLLYKRNQQIRATYNELIKGRCAKWRNEEVVRELSRLFFISEKRIYSILQD